MFCVDEKQLVVWSEGTNAADFTVQFLSTPFDGGDNHQFTGYKPNGVASVNDQGNSGQSFPTMGATSLVFSKQEFI